MSVERYEGPLQPLPLVMYLVTTDDPSSGYMGRLYDDAGTALRMREQGEMVVEIRRSLETHPPTAGGES